MKLKSLLVLLLAGIWGVGSWWWYTCKIKGFCGADVKTAQVAAGVASGGAALSSGAGNSSSTDDTKDSDNDGIPDLKEIELGLNPNNADTDGDGVADGKEVALGLKANQEDTDGDGISDAIELAQSSQDTDGDGKINALDNDDDGDGVLTADERPDPNGDGNVDDATDSNGNKIADYLEKDVNPAASTQTAAGDTEKLAAEQKAKEEADKKLAAEQKAKEEADKKLAAEQKAKEESEKLAAEQKAKEEADKKLAAEQKAKEESEKLAAEQKAKEEADKKLAAEQKAKEESEKLAAEQKAKEEADKVTIETTTTQGGDIGPATLHFPTGSANPELATETKAYFEKVAQYLKANPNSKITIVGHTDNKGDAAKNKALGLKRAEMLQKMLVDSGAPKERVSAASEGPNKPIADNATEEGRKKNRRVEITPIK